jgi:hypothetical protein
MRLFLLIPLLFFFPPAAYADIHAEANAHGGDSASVQVNQRSTTTSTSTTTTTSNGNTDVYTNVNGKVQEYHSTSGGNVSVTNDGKKSSVTVNGKTETSGSQSLSPTPLQTEAQIRARIASEDAKIKAKMNEAKRRLEAQKKVLTAHSFNFQTFFEDLFKRIFHF